MSRRISIQAYLEPTELERRYRQAREGIARSQWQIIWLLATGQTTEQVAGATGYSAEWVRCLARRYNAQGPESMGDQRHHNPGGTRLLTPEEEAELDQALEGAAPDGGVWTSAKVAGWISTRKGRPVSVVTGWLYLRRLGWRLAQPRPRHVKAADHEAQEAFKKGHRERSMNFGSSTRQPKSTAGRWMSIDWGSSPSSVGSGADGGGSIG